MKVEDIKLERARDSSNEIIYKVIVNGEQIGKVVKAWYRNGGAGWGVVFANDTPYKAIIATYKNLKQMKLQIYWRIKEGGK